MAGLAASVPTVASAAARNVEISFYVPVAVGGTVAALISRLVDDFEREHPEIRVRPIYAGTYQEALAKSLTGLKSGTPPDLAVLLAADMYTLIDADAIVPFDDVSAAARVDPAWMEGFFPVLMANSRAGGRPGAFRSSVRPSCSTGTRRTSARPGSTRRPPANWQEMQGFAQRLTRRENSTAPTTRWACRSLLGLSVLAVPGPGQRQRRAADEH